MQTNDWFDIGWAMFEGGLCRDVGLPPLNDMEAQRWWLAGFGAAWAARRNLLDEHGIQCSMSARGNCYDNAVVESFFGLLKRECVNRARFRTRDEARAAVFDYIECFYNRKQSHDPGKDELRHQGP